MTSPGNNPTLPAGARGEGRPGAGNRSPTVAGLAGHPRIPPWRKPITRRGGEIQFGVGPGGSIITGISEPEADLLGRLDGSLSMDASYRLAVEAGVPARRWRALLDLVEDLGVLERSEGEPVRPPVILDGRGELVDLVHLALRRGGINSVIRPGAGAELDLATPAGPSPSQDCTQRTLAILVGPTALDPRSGDPWLRHGVTHLPVVADGPRAAVGPLVVASLRGPCLWCLDLHRTDRDRSWPELVAQVCGSPGDVVRHETTTETDPVLAQLVAGCVALMARSHLAGTPAPVDVSVEISLPWPRMDHRRWPIHPQCRRRHRRDV